jgi:tetratricopeptide (TPR) repeat protein
VLGSRIPFSKPLSPESVEHEVVQFERDLAACEQDSGADHPDTLAARLTLIRAYRVTGRRVEALALAEADAAACERGVGAEHPLTLVARGELARALTVVGRHEEGIDLHQQALADCQRILGADHHGTVLAQLDLDDALLMGGNLVDPEPYQQALGDAERILGPDHPDTLYARQTLATACLRARRRGTAISLSRRNLATCERVLGTDDPATFTCRHALGLCYSQAGRSADGVPLLEQAIAGLDSTVGPGSPNAWSARFALAAAYRRIGRADDAVALLEHPAGAGLEGNPRMLSAHRKLLALTYMTAGRHDDAVSLLRSELSDCEQAYGSQHPRSLEVRAALAAALGMTGQIAGAEELDEQVIAERTRALGRQHASTQAALDELAKLRRQPIAGSGRTFSLAVPRTPRGSSAPKGRRLAASAVGALMLCAFLADLLLAFLNDHRTPHPVVPIGLVQVVAVAAAVAGACTVAVKWRAATAASRDQAARHANLPSDSPYLVRAGVLDVLRTELAARYGEQPAKMAVALRQTSAANYDFAVLMSAAQFVALAGLAFSGQYFLPVFIVVVVVDTIAGFRQRGITRRIDLAKRQLADAVSASLGLDRWAVGTLPGRYADYLSWCENHGLEPYPYGCPAWDIAETESPGAGRHPRPITRPG